ncbi:class II fructose-bisphosphate aldolase [Candidatus Parcubacteria bacterium]|nr:MAG: class II fructose-bisphosphate aldolase [Candidatus Parcubacteria bacterium]
MGESKPLDLQSVIKSAEGGKVAIGHFNISDTVALRAIFEAARELKVPVMIGTAESERSFIGPQQVVALVKSLREEFNYSIFLNADHTHSLEGVKEAVAAGYDEILFDGSKLSKEENIRQTREVVEYVKSVNPKILVEGEIGYIGSSSGILKEIPAGAAIREEDLTTPEEAKEFVEKTGVDLFAPAVGNLHGIFANAPKPRLNIEKIRAIKNAVKIPLVLHGGSATTREDFVAAIKAGINIVHINTDIRVAWRKGLEEALKEKPDEVAPYRIYEHAVQEIKKVVSEDLKIFNLQ